MTERREGEKKDAKEFVQNTVTAESVAQKVADQFARLPQVVAVALSGSQTATASDRHSEG